MSCQGSASSVDRVSAYGSTHARRSVFAPCEVAVVHEMLRTILRCYLLGFDPVSDKDFDHRKLWIECKLQEMAAHMGVDLLDFALLSNHLHLIL